MIRYLKVDMQGQPNNQMYCTLTSVKVYGKSMHAVLKETLKEDPEPLKKTTGTELAVYQPFSFEKYRQCAFHWNVHFFNQQQDNCRASDPSESKPTSNWTEVDRVLDQMQ
mmetsp:Transcript_32987/g.50477  ORF Transcript_32987/g.50477 Transcript_32987/m.50477 type:complete len:110 (+) Transcript_32987:996-1325(+)